MTGEQIVAFLQALHADKIKVKDNGWVEACCPLAPWTHQKGTDNTPSFGIAIAPGERSHYSCFSCTHGSVEELLSTLTMYHHDNPQPFKSYDFKLCYQLLDHELTVLPLPEYGSQHEKADVFEEWPAYWIESFPMVDKVGVAYTYLLTRGVLLGQMLNFNLRFDPTRMMIVAPYKDVFGRFAGARGRSILPDAEGPKKHFDYSFQGKNNYRLVWYNEPVLNQKGPVVVVEGQFDCWKVAQVYPKVVANLTARPTPDKVKKLADSAFIIQIPDRDETGELSVAAYSKLCKQFGIRHKVLRLDEGVKDPADCHPDYLKEKIEALL